MNKKYIYIYNNLINYTRNKDLYNSLNRKDNFSDRLTLFLLHFSFFVRNFKDEKNKIILQEIYDFNFRQIELSIREIGYGDQSINKKMKDYLNLFYAMINEIHDWDSLEPKNRISVLLKFLDNRDNIVYLVDYFEKYRLNLLKNTLNSYIKGVIKH